MMQNLQSATSLGNWIILLFVVLSLFWLILRIVQHFRHRPPLHKEYATRGDHLKLEGRVENLSGEVRGALTRLDKERRVSVSKVYETMERHMTEINQQLKENDDKSEARTKAVHDRVNELSHRVDTVPDRVVELILKARKLQDK